MYATLIFLHSMVRWLAFGSLVYAAFRGWMGLKDQRAFTKADNAWRHWTATALHTQLAIGMLLYFQRPITSYFWSHFSEAIQDREMAFFGIWHISLMLVAVVLATMGSALAKRKTVDAEKFRTMALWFTVALIILLVAIPWPFSPWVQRPYIRAI